MDPTTGPPTANRPGEPPDLVRTLARLALAGYLLVLLKLTLFAFPQPDSSLRLRPLATVAHYWALGGPEMVRNLGGNLAAFVPLGALAPLVVRWRVTAFGAVGLGAVASLAIEVAQFLSRRRVADVDDVLLNAAGCLAGFGLLGLLRWLLDQLQSPAPVPIPIRVDESRPRR